MGGGAEDVPVGMPETMDSRIGAVVRTEDFQELEELMSHG